MQAGGIDTEQLKRQGIDSAALAEEVSTNGSGTVDRSSNGANGSSAESLNPSAEHEFDDVASVAPQGADSGQDAKTSEDYWSPQTPESPNFQDDYGAIPAVPQHDGTICLKWDESLKSHADHFRVCYDDLMTRCACQLRSTGLAKPLYSAF